MTRRFIIHNLLIVFFLLLINEDISTQALAPGACDPPVITYYSNRQLNSIRVNWINPFLNDAWEIEWVESGDDFSGEANTPLIDTTYFDFTGLEAGTSYCFKIRSICGGDEGKWSSAVFCFMTSLNNVKNCSLDFDMQDPTGNLDYKDNKYYLIDEAFQNGSLGENVFIQNVELIIEHAWPSDLEIFLESPGGKSIVLCEREGFNSQNLGILNNNCDSTLLFSDYACESINEQIPLLGSFRPQEAFSILYDSSSLNGNWVLTVRDHNPGHRGVLQSFNIHLSETTCRLPSDIFVIPNGPNTCNILWQDVNHNCDSIIVEYGPEGFIPGNGTTISLVEAQNGFELDGLEAGSVYEFYFKAACGSDLSEISCPYALISDCNTISMKEDFDGRSVCELECDTDCMVSDIWFSRPFPSNPWLVNNGATSTENTGPDHDVSGFGNYIYVESSENNCSFNSLAILETDCLEFSSNFDACDFSFSYHMHGPDIGSLEFQVSTDDGENWNTLFFVVGDQGNAWYDEKIDLSQFHGLAGRVRFVTILNNGTSDRGDLALDNLIFYGTKAVVQAQYLYYPDADGDNYGDQATPVFFCSNSLVDGFSRNNLDCDDENEGINPEGIEIPCNSIDENCNGIEDDLDLENPLTIEGISIVDESCLGLKDGMIALEISGGAYPYTFLWSNTATDSLLTDVGEGKYVCEIMDAFGCRLISDSLELHAGGAMDFELLEKSIVSCSGAKDGFIRINHMGGVPPHSYLWNNGATTKDIEELSPGSYQLTITDSIGCTLVSPQIELTAATNFIVGLEIIQPLCQGFESGSVQIVGVQDGIPPFTYQWSTGDTSSQIENLEAGIYQLTVTDASFCFEVYDSISIVDPQALNADIVAKDDISCYGESDGAIEINTTGGTSPYTFQWLKDGSIFSSQDDLYKIKSGNYQLIIRDNNGCEFIADEIILSEPDLIEIQIENIIHADCSASQDGSIEIEASGGSGEYQYFWNSTILGDTIFDYLNPGLYNVVVTDRYGCKGFENGIQVQFLDVPIPLELLVLDSLKCFSDSIASLEVIVPEVALPLDFNWSAGIKRIKGSFRDTINQLPAGSYNITVTDAEGCIGESDVLIITQPEILTYAVNYIEPSLCHNDLKGAISIFVEGGNKPYSIQWDNGQNGNDLLHLDGGYYSALITDDKGCSLRSDSLLIFEPQPIEVEVLATAATSGMTDGSATVIPSGGSTPYYFQWDENTGYQTTQTATNLAAGNYYVTITDHNDCVKIALVIVPLVDAVADPGFSSVGFRVFPIPTTGVVNVLFEKESSSILNVMVYNAYGELITSHKLYPQINGSYSIRISDHYPGIYFLRMERAGKLYGKRIIKIH